MMKFVWRYVTIAICICTVFANTTYANEFHVRKDGRGRVSSKTEELTSVKHNFELIVTHISESDLPEWKGSVFSLKTGKSVEALSSKERVTLLPTGNYVLMVSFDEDIAELKGHRPFTFSISPNTTTIFRLQIGRQHEPEVEHGVGRSGADFVESDPRKGRDYLNFELPPGNHEPCLQKCKDDPNCDAYSYGKLPEWPKARCWLIHGAASPSPSPYAISGVITRENAALYQVDITMEQRER